MKHIIVLIIVLILILMILIFEINKISNKKIEGLNTFNGRMAVDDQYFYDKIFDDVIYYPNEYAKNYDTGEEIGKLLVTGWIKCKQKCPGHCVEYGVSGNAYCFPY